MGKFMGWKFGGNLTSEAADIVEPFVDVMTETLSELLRLEDSKARQQDQHTIALLITQYTGRAASIINDISFLLVKPVPDEEKLAELNRLSTALRRTWITVTALANIAVVNLDERLKDKGT